MAEDNRNQGIVGMSDGIPMFRDKHSRSVVPIALRTANLPDHLSTKFNHIHLAALYPGEYWTIMEEDKTQLESVPRKPKNLGPLMHVLVDDLLFWEDGQTVVDHSLALEDPRRSFTLHALLLYWQGDYPGLGEATNFAHMGTSACHWCKDEGTWGYGINREIIGGYIRYTPLCTFVLQYYFMFT